MKGLKEQVRSGEITAQQAMDDIRERHRMDAKPHDVTKTPTYRWLKAKGAKA